MKLRRRLRTKGCSKSFATPSTGALGEILERRESQRRHPIISPNSLNLKAKSPMRTSPVFALRTPCHFLPSSWTVAEIPFAICTDAPKSGTQPSSRDLPFTVMRRPIPRYKLDGVLIKGVSAQLAVAKTPGLPTPTSCKPTPRVKDGTLPFCPRSS